MKLENKHVIILESGFHIFSAYGLELSYKQLDILISKKGKEVLARMVNIQKELGTSDSEGAENGKTSNPR